MRKTFLKDLISWLRSPGDGLGQRVLHGGIWSTSLNISDRGLQIVRLVVLARLLGPSDFGLIGIAMLAMAVLKQLANLGIDPALVQREQENIDSYLDTVWMMKIGRGIGLFVILFFVAPYIAALFGEPRAQPILRAMGPVMVLNGLVNPSVVYFRKNLEFHKQFLYRISGSVTNLLVAVGAALIIGNVWALVYGLIAGNLIQLVVSYLLSSYRPGLGFEREAAAKILDFGKWIWAAGLTTFIATSGDDAFVGWYLTATALGFYQMAFRLSNAPATEVTHVISSITFPTYSKIQNDKCALQNAFQKTIQVTFLVAIPMSIGIFLIAPQFTRIVLGKQWLPMVPAMQIMAIGGMLRAIAATGGAIFKGCGIPEWDFRMNSLRSATIFATIWPLTDFWGISGAALSITLGISSTIPVWIYKTSDITGLPFINYGKAVLTPLVGSILMAGPVWFVLGRSIWQLGISILVGAVVYFAVILLFYRYQDENPVYDIIALAK